MKSEKLFESSLPEAMLCGILGTMPASAAGVVYQGFAWRFNSAFGMPDGPYSANAYDALYLLAYAIATEVNNVSGPSIRAGLKRLSSGELVEAGPSAFQAAAEILASSGNAAINYEGASGHLDLDGHGEAAVDIEAWALDLDNKAIGSLGVILTSDDEYIPLEDLTPGIGTACDSIDTDADAGVAR